jgi:hypothetical protein
MVTKLTKFGLMHLPIAISHTNIEISMEWSHNCPDLGCPRFVLVDKTWLYFIVVSYINFVGVFGSRLGSYHEYGTYL